jgi:phytanoyl-CoA hydroxylase
MKLSQEQVAQFDEKGYIVIEDLLSADEFETLRQEVADIAEGRTPYPEESIEYEPGATGHTAPIDRLRKLNQCARHNPVFLAHARHPAILDVAESLLGPDLKLFGDQMFLKPPGGMEKTYHQDSPYFKIEPMNLVSSWVAMDDVTLGNGCLWVVPGSHKGGALDHSEGWMVGKRQDMTVPETAFDRSVEEPIVMTAGGGSFHHSLLLHRSGPNNTPHRRRGLATHYMSAQSRWTGAPEDKPDYLLLQGSEFEGCV